MLKKLKLILILCFCLALISCSGNKASDLERKIVCFGDSLTQGVGASYGETYPDFLSQMTGIPVVNLGVSGNTSMQALARIDEVLKQKAFIVLIEFGANDFFRKIPISKTKKTIEQIVDKIQDTRAAAVIISTEDSQLPELYKTLKKISEDKDAGFIDGMLNEIWQDRDLFYDELHPNSLGYRKAAEKIYKALKPMIVSGY